MKKNKSLLVYLIKFLGVFCVLFYGTEAIIGFSSPGNHYNAFIANHLNFINPFRRVILSAAKSFLSVFGYETRFADAFTLSKTGGRGVRMVYSCIGYGVLSFWIAFVFANNGSWQKKAVWMFGGCVALCAINVLRISLLLVAINKGWPIPLGWDHHTWFNIVTYALIFAMIYFYDYAAKKNHHNKQGEKRLSAKRVNEFAETT